MAFITAETRSDLIELSVAMLKQAPSAALLEELIALSVGGGSLADAADHIADTAAFKAEYPSFQTAGQYAAEIFDNITTGGTVTADIRTAVIELATGMLTSGSVTKSGLALAIAEYLAAPAALLNADFADIAQSFQNRADAAEYFVVTKELGGSTAAELAAAIASVTSAAATLTAANTAADATASAVAVVAGQTFTLTTGLDTLTGASTNDTFSAVDSGAINSVPTTTINSGDSINAGAGTDRLSIVASTGSATTSAQVSSSTIEEVAVYNNSAAAYAADTTLMTGLTDLFVVAGINDVSFTGVNSSPNVHLTSVSNGVTVTNAATVGLGDADAVTIALNGAAATAASTLTYNDIETFNVVTSGAATGTATRSQSLVSADLETVNVSGSAAANITVAMTGAALDAQVGTLDASDMTGALTATVGAGVSGLLSVTGGSGADVLTVNSGAMNSDLTINGGAGVDTLVVTSAAYSATAATQAGAGVTNMEVLLVAGSADLRSFSNNTFAGLVSAGAASITGLGTDAVALTMTAAGNQTLDRATDGAADAATVSFAGTSAFTVASLNVADEETVTINSGSVLAGSNAITSLVGTDLTSLTIAGSRDLTISAISGTKLATVDASGLSGLGTQLVISGANSTADMTVTGAAGVAALAADVMNNITTGAGDDAITTGDYNDTINAGEGDNTVVAGDGDNIVTTGRGDDTITVGDGDNTITAGIGDDTVTAGGTTTSTAVFDTNNVDLGNGDDTYTGGAGKDNVTLGAGDDTVDTGAGTDTILMSDFDDDDVVNGGAGTDTLSVTALAAAASTFQIQAAAKFIDVTPGASLTSSPQFTAVENVYMQVAVSVANTEATAATNETVDFTASSGITNLYLEIDDQDAAAAGLSGKLTLSKVDAAAIHLVDRETTDDLGELVVAGDGQASLTVKGYNFDGGTDLTVSDVDALTITSYLNSATVTVGTTALGDVEADDADTVTATMAGTSAALSGQTLTLASLSADGASAINLNAGAFNTLAITGDVTSTSDALDTMAIVVSDDGTMTVNDIRSTGAIMTSATITIGVAGSFTAADEVDLASVEDVTVTVGAAGVFNVNDLVIGGDAVINATMGSAVTIDVFGVAGMTSTYDINGRGTLAGGAGKAYVLAGVTTLNLAGWTDTAAGTVTITTGTEAVTFIGNNEATSITTGAGADSITGGTGVDTVVDSGAGIDTITLGAGDDVVTDAGTGADVINMGAGDDTVTDAGAGADSITGGEGADAITGGAGADSIILTETTAATDTVSIAITTDSVEGTVAAPGYDSITGFAATAASNDKLLIAGAAVPAGAGTIADATTLTTETDTGTVAAALSVTGIVTVSGTSAANVDTLAEWIDIAEALLLADVTAQDATATATVAFEFDGNTYVVQGSDTDAVAGDTTIVYQTDAVVELIGLTGVTGLNGTAAANVIEIA